MRLLALAFTVAASLVAAEPHPSLPAIGSLDGLGVNIHFTEPQPGELEMIKAAGFRWVRMDLAWSSTEKARGGYDFNAYDRLVAALEKHDLRALFILDYGNSLYAEPGDQHPFTSRASTDEFRAAYARWAAAAVARYAGKGFVFELWNEPNHEGFWKPKPNAQHYAALAKAACIAIAKAAPKEALIGPATSTIDLPFIEECFKAGLLEHWSAVSVHPYRQQAPETVEEEYRQLRLLIRRYAPQDKAIPIVSSEWGYSTQYPAFAGKPEAEREQMQAKYLARMVLTNIANDIPLSIWYDWRDDGDNPREVEHRFGIVRRAFRKDGPEPFEPKPAYRSAIALAESLRGTALNKNLTDGTSLLTDLLFAGGSALCRVIVTPLGEVTYEKPTAGVRRQQLQAAADWSRAPRELHVRAPSRVDLLGELVNSGDKMLAADFLSVLKGADQEVFVCGFPFEKREPKWQLQPGSRAIEKGSFEVTLARRGQYLLHHVFVGDGHDSQPFTQRTELLVENAVEMEIVAPRPEGFLFRITNPTGQAINGSAALALTTSSLSGGRGLLESRVPIEWPDGKAEGFLFFPWPRRSVSAEYEERNFYLWFGPTAWRAWDQCSAGFNSGDGKGTGWGFSQRFARPHVLDGLAMGAYETRHDGDRSVAVTARIETGEPFDGGCPSRWLGYRLRYSFGAGWRFTSVHPKTAALLPIENKPRAYDPEGTPSHTFGLWLHGDGKGCQARIRFTDVTGQTFQPDGPKIDFKGWRFVTFPMQSTPEVPLAHWGGANDGVIHYPIKWDSIFLLDNVSRQPVEGEVYLSAPTLFY